MKNPKSFEEGMTRLQDLLDRLRLTQVNVMPLEEAISLYTETAALAEYCTAALDKAQLKMQTIDERIAQLSKPQEASEG